MDAPGVFPADEAKSPKVSVACAGCWAKGFSMDAPGVFPADEAK
eukprot:CAMPEP_0182916430 /NCGR_PEP_ID=MMETSP0105_2-20130417/937_2 /TAXON_ID=81532 ORGANISM="Acanthoeca-like sp., Strain 10tr" /NCGR_SAMPLE_ID=MMETSP0105_2 /ASSEMBLY_ACC=CAM_ASM_000205 /LENGTH=43 /DNA_ID= /DNA_START= /DNA_END= /DNA_ORIENTATION=